MGTFIWIVLSIVLVWWIIRFIRLSKPFDEETVRDVSIMKRKKKILKVLPGKGSNSSHEKSDLKKKMYPRGSHISVDIKLNDIASECTKMLKYKKYEWVIFAYARGDRVKLLYTLRGTKNRVRFNRVPVIRKARGYEALFVFHNHPPVHDEDLHIFQQGASKRRRHRIRMTESGTDRNTAETFARELVPDGVMIAKYICGANDYKPYYMQVPDSVCPLKPIEEEVRSKADNRFNRYGMRVELRNAPNMDFIKIVEIDKWHA